jgi:hypothetical protein
VAECNATVPPPRWFTAGVPVAIRESAYTLTVLAPGVVRIALDPETTVRPVRVSCPAPPAAVTVQREGTEAERPKFGAL